MVNITDDEDNFSLDARAKVLKLFPDDKTKLLIYIGSELVEVVYKQGHWVVDIGPSIKNE